MPVGASGASSRPAPPACPPQAAGGRRHDTPDLFQAARGVGFAQDGRNYCGPAAVSNALVWLGRRGYPRLVPKTRDAREAQIAVVRALADPAHMGTSRQGGTSTPQTMRGAGRYVRECGYCVRRLQMQGWRPAGLWGKSGDRPNVKWIEAGLRGPGVVWINIGWYRYDRRRDEYRRIGGHYVTVVGYSPDAEGQGAPGVLIVHDPATRAPRPKDEIARLVPIASGRLVGGFAGLPVEAKGFYRLAGGLRIRRGAEVAILDCAVVMQLADPYTPARTSPTLDKLERLGGRVDVAVNSPGGAAVALAVDLEGAAAADADLKLLALLRRLRRVRLRGTKITGAALVNLAGLADLEELDLRDTGVDDAGLSHLRGLARLRVLSLRDARGITGAGMAHLAGLARLERLYLRGTRVDDTGLARLKGLAGVKTLDLGRTAVTDAGMKHLAHLPALESLHLTDLKITDAGVARIAKWKNLVHLSLSGTRASDGGLGRLVALKRLRTLWLSGTQIGDAGMAHLGRFQRLEQLYLDKTRVTDKGLAHLKGLKRLRTLTVRDTTVSADAAKALQAAMPGLRVRCGR